MRFSFSVFFLILSGLVVAPLAHASEPVGADTFQLLSTPQTGADNTGDGGTGNPSDFNYFYVGQSFSTMIEIASGGTTSANIWIDYISNIVAASNLVTGSFFNTWSGQTIDSDATGPNGGRIYSTGAQIPTALRTGTGSFGSVDWTALQPTSSNYGTGAAAILDIVTGVIGETTESNIAFNGIDLLDDVEDFSFHIWADITKPFAENPSPQNAAVGVSVDSTYTFDLRDTLNGEGDNTGVGTGVNTSTPPGTIQSFDGTNTVDLTAFDAYSCSGTWGTNYCHVTVNPSSPSGIAGDSRNWSYNTTYTIIIDGYQDLASPNQDQLGDPNGPNTMDQKVYTFTTESDTSAPQVVSETPTRGSSGNSVSTSIDLLIEDRKSYPSTISGTGLDASTCRITVQSPSVAAFTYQSGDAFTAVSDQDYGSLFSIQPSTPFTENETVSVQIDSCTDYAGNVMTPDQYIFLTSDNSTPYVDEISPINDASVSLDGVVSFHLKDSGVGVDLSQTVIYINGVYYTELGGAGEVTVNGTRITFDDSLSFNGGNYVGDTTSVTGTAQDAFFLIDPELSFTEGESIPVAIYTKDVSGNIMERELFALSTGGSSCATGSSFCGENTSWNGATCVGVASTASSTTTRSGGGGTLVRLEIPTMNLLATQVDEDSVLITWFSSLEGSGRILYDTTSIKPNSEAPLYGFTHSTEESNDNSVYHSMLVHGLQPGTVYYFRPVTRVRNQEVVGPEVTLAPLFAQRIIETYIQGDEQIQCPTLPASNPTEITTPVYYYQVPSTNPEDNIQKISLNSNLKITEMQFIEEGVGLRGIGDPNTLLNIKIY